MPGVHGATELTLAGGRARHQLRGGRGPARWYPPRDPRRRENTSLSRPHALKERLEIVVGRNRHALLVRRGESTGGGLARRGNAAGSRRKSSVETMRSAERPCYGSLAGSGRGASTAPAPAARARHGPAESCPQAETLPTECWPQQLTASSLKDSWRCVSPLP